MLCLLASVEKVSPLAIEDAADVFTSPLDGTRAASADRKAKCGLALSSESSDGCFSNCLTLFN